MTQLILSVESRTTSLATPILLWRILWRQARQNQDRSRQISQRTLEKIKSLGFKPTQTQEIQLMGTEIESRYHKITPHYTKVWSNAHCSRQHRNVIRQQVENAPKCERQQFRDSDELVKSFSIHLIIFSHSLFVFKLLSSFSTTNFPPFDSISDSKLLNLLPV